MQKRGSHLAGALLAVVVATTLATAANAEDQPFSLIRAVPNDVFLCVAGRDNPEREFLESYWGEVFDALAKCGIGDDALKLIGSLFDADQNAEFERLKERAVELFGKVDWTELVGQEVVFAERLPTPDFGEHQGIQMGPPHMVCLFRQRGDGAARNFEGLVAILQGAGDELSRVIGKPGLLMVERTHQAGAEVARLRMANGGAKYPAIHLTLTDQGAKKLAKITANNLNRRIAIVMDGKLLSAPMVKAQIAKHAMINGRFTPAEAESIATAIRTAVAGARTEGIPAEPRLQCRLVAREGDSGPVDEYPSPDDESGEAPKLRVLKEVLIDESGVEAADVKMPGYGAPPIALSVAVRDDVVFIVLGEEMLKDVLGVLDGTGDKGSLADEPRFKAAFTKLPPAEDAMFFFDMQAMLQPMGMLMDAVVKVAAHESAEDVVLNSSKTGEAYELSMQAWKIYEKKDYEQGLKLVEQAHELAPNDSRVLYYLSCFHALLGDDQKALDFLERAVDGGFYCPGHISRDPDLASVRGHTRYEAALEMASKRAAQATAKGAADTIHVVQRISTRIMDAVGALDYVAEVESTDGFAVRGESVAVLVPDAKDRPIYPIFGTPDPLSGFDRYLPKETASFSVSGGLDIGALYTFLEDTARAAGPKGEELLAMWNGIQAQFGVDVRQDVIDWMAGNSVSVTLDDGGWVWMLEVTDEETAREKVGQAVEFLSEKLAEIAPGNPMLAMLSISRAPTLDDRLPGFEELRFVMSPQPLVWGVAEKHLILGGSADAVAMCLETAKGEHPNIRENSRAMAEAIVPTGAFTSVTLTDQRKLGEEIAGVIGAISMASGMMTMAIPDPEVRPIVAKVAGMIGKLTPVVRKINFYKSTATCTTFDGRAWHSRTVIHYVPPSERSKPPTP